LNHLKSVSILVLAIVCDLTSLSKGRTACFRVSKKTCDNSHRSGYYSSHYQSYSFRC
jgi:hypothetical protein